MTAKEQENTTKRVGYAEAMRYIANAKGYLQKAGIEGDWYKDKKYVRTACGTAYNGVLEALDTYFKLKKAGTLETKERKTIDFYRENLVKENKKVLKILNSAYNILHLSGYYDGTLEISVIKIGFQRAKEIIDLIKPAGAAL
jgi:hypothetical protein